MTHIFFFSSRRRHTRCGRDWSSDVCSSDLHLAGGEAPFADMMNQHATRLGLHNTNFQNATGLPGDNHYSSARDMALLSRYIINDYPEHYAIYAEKYFTYNDIRQPNRNRLLWRDPTVDGLKTGWTTEAGYGLVASAKRDDMRLVSVVMGTSSEEARAQETQKLRSEEHTSELQSRPHLVCRLLLEKKKNLKTSSSN